MGGRLFRFWGWLKVLRHDAVILYYAWKHPLTPNYIKGLLVALLAYLVSPLDILPDYLPAVGIADDAALISAAVLYLPRLLPSRVVADCKRQSQKWSRRLPYIFGLLLILGAVWMVVVVIIFRKLLE
ncbi:YkvA family protein [Sporomusa carbonis]|uniref:YkvA family protein n=1 Tax=Sporomusa carbonis TaxID=3076075 RepID=UPI003C7D9269